MAIEDVISEICIVIQLRLTGQVKQWMLVNRWDIALIVLVRLVHPGPTVHIHNTVTDIHNSITNM